MRRRVFPPDPWRSLAHALLSCLSALVVLVTFPLAVVIPPVLTAEAEAERQLLERWGFPTTTELSWWRKAAVAVVSLVTGVVASVLVLLVITGFGALIAPLFAGRVARGGWDNPVVGLLLFVIAVVALCWVGFGRLHLTAQLLNDEERRLRAQVDQDAARAAVEESARAAERRRMERQLHDGAQLHLTSSAMHLALAERALTAKADGDPELARVLADLRQARGQNKIATNEVRAVAHGLQPSAPAPFHGRVHQILDATGLATTLAVDVDVDHTIGDELALVVSEAVDNVLKHAHATRIDVGLTRRDGMLVLTLRDDGIGGATPSGGLGLRTMTERVYALGGRITIVSPAGGPTVLTATIPEKGRCAS